MGINNLLKSLNNFVFNLLTFTVEMFIVVVTRLFIVHYHCRAVKLIFFSCHAVPDGR